MFIIQWIGADGSLKAQDSGMDEARLVADGGYEEGDRLAVESTEGPVYAWLQLEDVLGRSLVYLKGRYEYRIPFGEKRVCYSPRAFTGEKHLITVRRAEKEDVHAYRNLALNVNDQHGNTACFPRAHANVETRGESVFAAMNAIDGITENRSHGEWPYASWGINRQDDAELTLEFGRPVQVDKVILYTRADFPHDNWWVDGRLTFSDGSSMRLPMESPFCPMFFLLKRRP